jgi:hypothetical protein
MMRRTIRLFTLLSVFLAATVSQAQSASDFYLGLLHRGVTSVEAGQFDSASTPLRIAAFGLVDSIESYETALVHLSVAQDQLNDADGARDSLRRLMAAERIERRYPTLALAPAIRANFESAAKKYLSPAELSALSKGAALPPAPPRTQPVSTVSSSSTTKPAASTPMSTATATTPARTTSVEPSSAPRPTPAPQTTTASAPSVAKSPVPATAGTTSGPAIAAVPVPIRQSTATDPRPADVKPPAKPATVAPSTATPATASSQTTTPRTSGATPPTTTPSKPPVAAPQTTTPQKPAQAKPAAPVASTTPRPAAKTLSPREVSARLTDADRALNTTQLPEARRLYREVLDSSGVDRDSMFRVAEGLYRVRDFPGALQALKGLAPLRRGEEPYGYYYAVALYETGAYDAARKELAAALPFIEMTPDVVRSRQRIEGAH